VIVINVVVGEFNPRAQRKIGPGINCRVFAFDAVAGKIGIASNDGRARDVAEKIIASRLRQPQEGWGKSGEKYRRVSEIGAGGLGCQTNRETRQAGTDCSGTPMA
jgi:hypothetical protein